jgi:hypothetical protein
MLSTDAGGTPNILDLFGMSETAGAAPTSAAAAPATSSFNNKASDDLLQLAGNPFASVLNASNPTQQSTAFSSSPFAATTTGGNANGIFLHSFPITVGYS